MLLFLRLVINRLLYFYRLMLFKRLIFKLCLLSILLAEKRKAALLGKNSYSRIDKRYKAAGSIEEINIQ